MTPSRYATVTPAQRAARKLAPATTTATAAEPVPSVGWRKKGCSTCRPIIVTCPPVPPAIEIKPS
jgi:hypothetical protein